jgi:hypothetical protein
MITVLKPAPSNSQLTDGGFTVPIGCTVVPAPA